MNVQHAVFRVVGAVDTVDGTYIHAGQVFYVNAGFCDDIGHDDDSLLSSCFVAIGIAKQLYGEMRASLAMG